MAETLEIKTKVTGVSEAKREVQSLSSGIKQSVGNIGTDIKKAFAFDGFKAGLGNIKSGISDLSSQMMNLSTIGVTAVAGLGIAAIKTAADFEQIEIGLKGVLGSSAKADKTLARLKKEAAITPFTFKGLANFTTLLSSVTKDGDRSINLIMGLGDALSFAGKGEEELSRLVANLQQIKSVGKASLMDLRQFGVAGIPIFELLQKQLGVTGEQLSEMTSDGKITFEVLEKAFLGANKKGGVFFGSMKRQSKSLNGILSNIGDTVELALNDIAQQSGVFDMVKDGATDFLKVLQDNIPAISNFIKTQFVPALKQVFQTISSIVGPILKWAQENPELVKQLVDIVLKLMAVNAVLRIGMGLFGGVGKVILGIAQVTLPLLSTAVTGIVSGLGSMAAGFIAIAGPIVATVAVVTAATVAIIALVKAVNDVINAQVRAQNAAATRAQIENKQQDMVGSFLQNNPQYRGKIPKDQSAITYIGNLLASKGVSRQKGGKGINAFAGGGIVPGNSYSGDNVLARMNSGEMILNKQQQAMLFKMIAQGGNKNVNFNAPVTIGGSRGKAQEMNLFSSLLMKTV